MTDEALNPKDAQLLEAYLASGSMPEAASTVGMVRTTAWRRAKRPAFQAELLDHLEEQRRHATTALLARQEAAWKGIDQSLASTDGRIRLRAAMWLLDRVMAAPSQDASRAASVVDVELEETLRALLAGLRLPEGERS